MKKIIFVFVLMIFGGCGSYYETPEEHQRNVDMWRDSSIYLNDLNRQQQERQQNYQIQKMQMDLWRLRH